MILSRFELASAELRKAAERRAREITPQHAAAAASLADGRDGDEPDGESKEAERRRERIQHLADPYPDGEAVKAYRDAYEPPASYPRPIQVSPEDFRRGPIRDGQGALSPGHEPPLSFPCPQLPTAGGSAPRFSSPPSHVDGGCP